MPRLHIKDLRSSDSLDSTNALDLRNFQADIYDPSDNIREYTQKLKSKFLDARRQREMSQDFFGNRSPEQYWKDSENRWLSNLPTSRKKAWQARVVKPVTRNKCIGVIAYLLSSLIEPDFFARKKGLNSEQAAQVISDLFEVSKDLDRNTLKYLLTLVDAVCYGTAFIQEDYVNRVRKIKDIKSWNPLTWEMEYSERDMTEFEGFLSSIVSPFEVFLGDMFTFEMRNQPYIFRRSVLPFTTAQSEFGHLPTWKFVQPGATSHTSNQDTDRSVFSPEPFSRANITTSDVEILRYQSKFDDEVATLIQGILMTPPKTPIPYQHKEYNLVKAVFEPINARCAYGKSMPDRLMGEQDVIDTLYRMVIDKTFLTLFPPLLSKGREKLTANIIEPGLVTPIDSESDVMVPTGISNGVGNELNLLSLVERSMDSSSIDPQHLGVSAGGERSATQVLQAKSGAEKILGLFAYMITFMIEDFARLRAQNILQFWAERQDEFFEIPERELRNGTSGSRILKFAYKNLHPSSKELFMAERNMRKQGRNVNFAYIDPDELRAFEVTVRVKANPTERLSPALEKALGLEFYQTFINNPLISLENLTRDTLKLYDKDPMALMKQSSPIPPTPAGASPVALSQKSGQLPSRGNLTQQLRGSLQPRLRSLIQEPVSA